MAADPLEREQQRRHDHAAARHREPRAHREPGDRGGHHRRGADRQPQLRRRGHGHRRQRQGRRHGDRGTDAGDRQLGVARVLAEQRAGEPVDGPGQACRRRGQRRVDRPDQRRPDQRHLGDGQRDERAAGARRGIAGGDLRRHRRTSERLDGRAADVERHRRDEPDRDCDRFGPVVVVAGCEQRFRRVGCRGWRRELVLRVVLLVVVTRDPGDQPGSVLRLAGGRYQRRGARRRRPARDGDGHHIERRRWTGRVLRRWRRRPQRDRRRGGRNRGNRGNRQLPPRAPPRVRRRPAA